MTRRCRLPLVCMAVSVVMMLASRADLPRLESRLEALRPEAPLEYFLLGEEVADVARSADDRQLARQLYGLAGALDRERLGRSACLARADIEEDPLAKRRLLALADLLDDRVTFRRRQHETQQLDDPAAAYAVAQALHHYRLGEGSRALRALEQAGARTLLERHDAALRGGVRRFIEDCELYRSGKRPPLGENDVSRLVHLEAALLAGRPRSWSDALLLSNGETLIEVEPDHTEQAFGVDVDRPYYRDGLWVSHEDARP